MPKISSELLLSLVFAAPKIVKNVKDVFGKGKTGAEKKVIATELLSDSVGITNAIAKKEIVDAAGAQALMSEAVEIGYQMMKLKERLSEIDDLVRAAKGSGQAPLIGEDGLD
jgi:hypothetical protein